RTAHDPLDHDGRRVGTERTDRHARPLPATGTVDEGAGGADRDPAESVLTEVRHATGDLRRGGHGTDGGLDGLQDPDLGVGTPPVTAISCRYRRHAPTPPCWSGREPRPGTASS